MVLLQSPATSGGQRDGPPLRENLLQPSFKLREKRREVARLIKRCDDLPSTPYERALAHPMVAAV